jgi:predicted Ser/Thr protein kinase
MQNQHPAARLRRRDLEAKTVRVIHQGKGFQSSVYLVESDGQRAAVKDFLRTPAKFRRFVAPWLVSREIKALKALDGTPGVPRFFGRVDRYAFAMEFIEGRPIAEFGPGELSPEVLARVQEAIDGIHARGVSHGDLKRRSNLLVTPDERIYLIDFAAALVGNRALNPFANWLQKRMAEIDDKSMLKIKKFSAPDQMSEDDWQRLNSRTPLEKWARRLLGR